MLLIPPRRLVLLQHIRLAAHRPEEHHRTEESVYSDPTSQIPLFLDRGYFDEDVFPVGSFSANVHDSSNNPPRIVKLYIHLCRKVLWFIRPNRKNDMFGIISRRNPTHIPAPLTTTPAKERYPIFMKAASARID